MSENVIEISGLAKAYRIGLKEQKNDTLGAAVTSWLKSPMRNFERLRKLSKFDNISDDDNDVFWALKDVSFNVTQGEVLGIIGRNGAGKSTLLKILSKITDPTLGEIRIKGRVASLLEVGTGFNPELTGRENIFLNGTILGMTHKEVDKKFDEIVDFSGVEKFIDTPVKRYSSGMKVRLGFAVAAYLEPEILIIDEVLAVGDAEFQKKCIGKMQEVSAKDGRTVLFVSHDMSAIGNLCNKCILLEKGKVDLISDTSNAILKYSSNISGSTVEDAFSSAVSLKIEEMTQNNLRLSVYYKILEGEAIGDLYIKILNGSNSEIVLYKEDNIKIYDKDKFIIDIDISSFKAGYYSLQSKFWATNSTLKNLAINSDYIPILIDRNTFKYPKGQLAPGITINKL